jgi:hypothetical protein
MDNDNKIQTRKKFIILGISAAALFSVFRFFRPEKKKKIATMKMLTQDGKLVEVELSKLSGKRKKIKDTEIHGWVKRKPDS